MSDHSEEDWADEEWEFILNRVRDGECVPFLGAGASAGILPMGAIIAQKLAKKFHYPLPDSSDLIKVSQYVAVRSDRKYVKEEVLRILNESGQGKVELSRNPYKHLARLPLPLYVTTNYDSLMHDALKAQSPRRPRSNVCRWNSLMSNSSSSNGEEPTVATPIVFHLHGSKEDVESLVLTEDDYVDFLTEMLRNPNLLPKTVESAIRKSTVLFIGYRLADWNFRILFQQLANYNVSSIAVFPPPSTDDPSKDKIQDYLKKYYGALRIRIYWATAEAFARCLVDRYAKKFGERELVGRP